MDGQLVAVCILGRRNGKLGTRQRRLYYIQREAVLMEGGRMVVDILDLHLDLYDLEVDQRLNCHLQVNEAGLHIGTDPLSIDDYLRCHVTGCFSDIEIDIMMTYVELQLLQDVFVLSILTD